MSAIDIKCEAHLPSWVLDTSLYTNLPLPLHACVQEIARVCARLRVCIEMNAIWDHVLFPYRRFFSIFLHNNKNMFRPFPEIISASISWTEKSVQENSLITIPHFPRNHFPSWHRIISARTTEWLICLDDIISQDILFTRAVWLGTYLTLDWCKSRWTCWDTRYVSSSLLSNKLHM